MPANADGAEETSRANGAGIPNHDNRPASGSGTNQQYRVHVPYSTEASKRKVEPKSPSHHHDPDSPSYRPRSKARPRFGLPSDAQARQITNAPQAGNRRDIRSAPSHAAEAGMMMSGGENERKVRVTLCERRCMNFFPVL